MILMDLVDLGVHRFKHGGDLGDLRCLQEPGEPVRGHGQVGAWGLVDIVAVNMDKFIIEVVLGLACPSLRVKLSLGHRKTRLICSALRTVDVPVDVGGAVLLGFPFPRGAVALTLKIAPPRKGGKGGCSAVVSATVSIEPWDSEFGFSSKMVWRDAAVQEALKNVEAMKNECNGIAGSFCFLLYSNFSFC